jgi:hypothetical protein
VFLFFQGVFPLVLFVTQAKACGYQHHRLDFSRGSRTL